MPKLFAFAKGAYGNPGLNMFSDEWGPYYIAGINLQWRIYDWNTTKRNKQIATIQQKSVDIKRDVFNKQINTELIKQQSEINKLTQLLDTDEKIVKIRKNITRKSESRLKNGTITSVDYAEVVNKENNAIIQKKIRTLKIINAKYSYLRILNLN